MTLTKSLIGKMAVAGAISACVGGLAVGSAQALWQADAHETFEVYRPALAMRLTADGVAAPVDDSGETLTATTDLITRDVLEDLAADGVAYRLYEVDAAALGNTQLGMSIGFASVNPASKDAFPMLKMARQRVNVVDRGAECGAGDRPALDAPGMKPVWEQIDLIQSAAIQHGGQATVLLCQALVLPADDGVSGEHENTVTVTGTGTVGGEVSASDTWTARITPKAYDWGEISKTDLASIAKTPGGGLGMITATTAPVLITDEARPSAPWAEPDGGDGTAVTLPSIQSKGN